MKKMRVALIGQGRSGKDIHGNYFASEANTNIEVVYVVDAIEERRQKAAAIYGCPVFATYQELFDKKSDIDLVVNASFSQMHYDITKDLLEHGFNVLVEKPFGRTAYECNNLIRIAKEKGVVVAAFHQSLFASSYTSVKKMIQDGVLGDVFQISLRYSGFARRWDWQTLQSCCAGSVFNSGPHPIGQALDLYGWDKNVRVEYCDLRCIITSGDGEDYGKIILSCPNKPTIDIEICSADMYNDYVFKVFGSKGTLKATNTSYKLKTVDLSTMPDRPVIREALSDANGNPVYCSEKLPIEEKTGEFRGSVFTEAVKEFYDMMYGTVMEGKELAITPEMAADVIRIIECCHAMKPLPVKY